MENYKYILNQSKEFVKQEIVRPSKLEGNQVLVKPRYVGICGSDLLELETSAEKEIHLGHEWVGTITHIGPDVLALKVGDTVTSSSHIGCGNCDHCKVGDSHKCEYGYSLGKKTVSMFSSFAVLPEHSLVKIDGAPAPEHILYECLSIARESYLQLKKISGINNDENILIIGAGTIGVLVAKYLQKYNLNITIADKRASRVKGAKKMGLTALPIQAMLLDGSCGGKFQTVIDCSSISGGDSGALKYLQYFSAESSRVLIVCKYKTTDELPIYILSNKRCIISSVASTSITCLKKVVQDELDLVNEIKVDILSRNYNEDELREAFDSALERSEKCKIIVAMG